MDSVQIYFICLDGIYYICILLHSSKKKSQGSILLFTFEKNDKKWYKELLNPSTVIYISCCSMWAFISCP